MYSINLKFFVNKTSIFLLKKCSFSKKREMINELILPEKKTIKKSSKKIKKNMINQSESESEMDEIILKIENLCEKIDTKSIDTNKPNEIINEDFLDKMNQRIKPHLLNGRIINNKYNLNDNLTNLIKINNQFDSINIGLKELINKNQTKSENITINLKDNVFNINILDLENFDFSESVINEIYSKFKKIYIKENIIRLYSDGACKEKIRRGYIGVICFIDDVNLFTLKGNIGSNNTNNVAEYMALLYGIILCKLLKMENTKMYIYSDSQLLVNQIKGSYKLSTPHISILNHLVTNSLRDFKNCEVTHILRNYNTEADDLANQAVKIQEKTIILSF